MRQVDRKKKRSLKHGGIWIAAGALLLLSGSVAAYLLWPAAAKKAGEEPFSGEIRAIVSEMTGGEAAPQPYTAEEELDIEREALHPVTQPEIYSVLLDRITVTGKDGTKHADSKRSKKSDCSQNDSQQIEQDPSTR